MCPLRLILIFLSATLAGFFVLKNLKAQPDHHHHPSDDDDADLSVESSSSSSSSSRSSKVWSAIGSGFWTCVDMASGRYLWRNLTSSSSSAKKL